MSVATDLQKQFADGSVWVSRDSVYPHDGVVEQLRTNPSIRAELTLEIGRLLTSPNLRERTGAVGVLREVVRDLGADRVSAILTANEPMFRGVKPAWQVEQDDLEQIVAIAIGLAVKPGDITSIGVLRKLARERKWGFYLVDALATVDGEWLVANAKGLVTHDQLGVLRSLTPDQADRLIAALSPYPPETPTFFTKAFWKSVPPEQARRWRRKMWPDA